MDKRRIRSGGDSSPVLFALSAALVLSACESSVNEQLVGPFPVWSSCATGSDCATGNCSNDRCAPEGFAYIPPGTFCMGSPDGSTECMGETLLSEPGRRDVEYSAETTREDPLHEVTLTRGFFLQETEVTQRQWTALGFSNLSWFHECGLDCPVDRVNWWQAVAYVNALSESEGLEPCYTLEGCYPTEAGTGIDQCTDITVSDPGASGSPYLCEGYRLPTEAEWEYAYRAGTTTAFYNGGITHLYCDSDANLDAIAWHCDNSEAPYDSCVERYIAYDGPCMGTHPVGSKDPNGWGVYDMAGNLYEWVWDIYDNNYYDYSPSTNPLGPDRAPHGNLRRVRRGGSFDSYTRWCRAAKRHSGGPGGSGGNQIGFRPAMSVLSDP